MQLDPRLVPAFNSFELQITGSNIHKRSNERSVSLVVEEKGDEVNFNILSSKGRGKRQIREVAPCELRLAGFFVTEAIKTEPRSQAHSRSLYLRLDVMKLAIEGFFRRTITKEVITTLVLHDAGEVEVV